MFYLIDRKTGEVFATESAVLADMLTRNNCHVCSKKKFEHNRVRQPPPRRLRWSTFVWNLRMIQTNLIHMA